MCPWLGHLAAQSLGGGDFGSEPVRIRADYTERWEDGETQILMASGNILAWQGTRESPTMELHCDSTVIWLTPLPPPDGDRRSRQRYKTEIYAEGNVRLYRGGGESFYGGDRLAFDTTGERGYVENAKFKAVRQFGKKRSYPLFVRAERFRALSRSHSIAEGASISTCEFGDPHYKAYASELEVIEEKDGNIRVKSLNNVLFAGDVPVFYFPYVEAKEGDTYLIKKVRAGNSNRFGTFLLTTWGESIGSWGEWRLHLDYRSDRGPATGLDVEYADRDPFGNVYKGLLETYYTRDHGEDRDGSIPPNDRWRIRGQHRHEFPDDLRLDLELSKIRDRNFLREYFEKEEKEGKEQETAAFLRKGYDNHLAWALARVRLNDFQTQTEYLPQLGYAVVAEPTSDSVPILENLLYSSETQVAHLRRVFDERLQKIDPRLFDDEEALRFDTNHRLDYPIQISFLRLTPFAEGRFTQYDHVLARNRKSRWVGSAGSRLSFNLWRNYDQVESDFLDLHRLRHVLTPEVRYDNVIDTSLDRERLIRFDSVETVQPLQEVRFRLTNRLLTRRFGETEENEGTSAPEEPYEDGESEAERIDEAFARPVPGGISEFVFLRADLPYFPKPSQIDRSNPFGVFDYDFRFYPRSWLALTNRLQYDFEIDQVSTYSVGLSVNGDVHWRPLAHGRRQDSARQWNASIGIRNIRESSLVGISTFSYPLSAKWDFTFNNQYDFLNEEVLESKVVLTRTFHLWGVSFEFTHDAGDDETAFSIAVSTPFTAGPAFKTQETGTESRERNSLFAD